MRESSLELGSIKDRSKKGKVLSGTTSQASRVAMLCHHLKLRENNTLDLQEMQVFLRSWVDFVEVSMKTSGYSDGVFGTHGDDMGWAALFWLHGWGWLCRGMGLT